MTGKLQVLVCDDDFGRAGQWASRISRVAGDRAQADPLDRDSFARAVAALKERKAASKQGGELAQDDATVFDEVDILVLDSDLTPDEESVPGVELSDDVQNHLVGELGGEVAHLARCYSTVKALVVVNQKWKRASFDLTLGEFANDVAEVYASEMDIDEHDLWNVPSTDRAFRPWTWPVLSHLPATLDGLRSRVDLKDQVFPRLGLSEEHVLSAFTDTQLDALGVEDWQTVDFETVAVESRLGLRLKEVASPEQMLRIAVCAVRRWLDRHVLPAQNVLIDAPHLMQLRPWTVLNRDDAASWNNRSEWFLDPASPEPTYNPSPEAYAAEASRWLGKHVWLWPHVSRERSKPGDRILPSDPVFCEDISMFTSAADATDWLSDLGGIKAQKFVAALQDVDYHPRRRLLT